MRTEVTRIGDQARRAFAGDCWFGPGVRPVLEGITAGIAAARPVPGAHSIHEVVLHMTAWKRVVAEWAAGRSADITTDEEDWRPATAAAWTAALEALDAAQRDLLSALDSVDDARLAEIVPNRDYTLYFALHGVVQHDIYHAGQIQILKRAALQ